MSVCGFGGEDRPTGGVRVFIDRSSPHGESASRSRFANGGETPELMVAGWWYNMRREDLNTDFIVVG